MSRFDRVIIADWSALGQRAPLRPSADAIWLGVCSAQGVTTSCFRSRAEAEAEAEAEAALRAEILGAKGRLLIGFDFPMGYPAGFATRLTGQARAKAVWRWLAQHLQDGPENHNNRFEIAAPIKDEAQVRLLARALWRLSQVGQLAPLFTTPAGSASTEEGWILGAGYGPQLEEIDR